MRIIGGSKRGLNLVAPTGEQTRPTMDRTREDIMNILENGKFRGTLKGASVADVFAGSGSIGLEMLSRGADMCTFYECNNNALEALNTNIKKYAIGKTVVRKDAVKPKADKAYNIVFMDAPYGENLTGKSFKAFVEKGLVNEDTLIIIQVAKTEDIPVFATFSIIDERKMSGAKVAFLKATAPIVLDNEVEAVVIKDNCETA